MDSEYGAEVRDADYHIGTDDDYDTECLNYDIVKRQILSKPGERDITQKSVNIRGSKKEEFNAGVES